jgi:outer membrane protein OmpA-like peptidoglycan-associated protein
VTNQRLSEQRAEAVRAALIAQGLNPARVTMVGYGEGQPVADNETPAGRAQNRRVEMLIVGARRPAVTPRP